jgi:hypothetical protein
VTEHKSPFDQMLDLVLFVPVGLVITAQEELPRLAEKGRERVTGQAAMAQMIGKFAVSQGQREASKVRKQAIDAFTGLKVIARNGRPGAPGSRGPTVARSPRPATNARTGGEQSAPSSGALAIPGYDSLSASQVVQRLGGLAPDELEAVRQYESATRGRRTILSKIAQLQPPQSPQP